jgi:hypothetical protein
MVKKQKNQKHQKNHDLNRPTLPTSRQATAVPTQISVCLPEISFDIPKISVSS